MGIYNVTGAQVFSAYSVAGENLNTAYSVDSDVVFVNQQTIKVMTYNVGQWYLGNHDNVPANLDEAYFELQSGIIARNDPDILFLNEYTKQFSKAGRTAVSLLQPYFPYIHEQADNSVTSGRNRAICSKYPITDYTVRAFGDASNLYYDSCTITINGFPLYAVVTHLHWDNRTLRIEEINKILTLVANQPTFIFAGDLNTLSCKSTTDEDYIAIMEPILNAGYHAANNDGTNFRVTYSDEPVGPYTGCLDNIVTSSNFTLSDIYVDTTKQNDQLIEKVDHMPLIATITLTGEP